MGRNKTFKHQLMMLHQWPNSSQLLEAYKAGNEAERAKLCDVIDEVFDTPRALDFAFRLQHAGSEPSRRILKSEDGPKLREAFEPQFEMMGY